jgi:poly(A) polymerase
LDCAVAATEAGEPTLTITPVSRDDYAALTAEELRPRLDRILMGTAPEAGLDALLDAGFFDALMPEVKALVGFGDGEWRHKDVWKHTKQVVAQAVPRLEVRWAALFHDIGKIKTRSISPEGEVHFLGHAEVGARLFEKLERRLHWFSNEPKLRESIRFLVLNHLRASQYDGSWTDSAVRRFTLEIGGELDNLLCLSRADITTKRPEKRRRVISYIDELEERVAIIAAQDAIVPPLPTGVGNDLMTTFKLPPSRLIGEIKRALEIAVDQGELESHRESTYYVEFVAEHRERFGIPKS